MGLVALTLFSGLLAQSAADVASPNVIDHEIFNFDGTTAIVVMLSTKLSLSGGKERDMGTGLRFGVTDESGTIYTAIGGQPSRKGAIICTHWDNPTSDVNLLGICEVQERSNDKWSMSYRCNLKGTAADGGFCWGGLTGVSGRYKGRNGSLTWHVSSEKMAGIGAWWN